MQMQVVGGAEVDHLRQPRRVLCTVTGQLNIYGK